MKYETYLAKLSRKNTYISIPQLRPRCHTSADLEVFVDHDKKLMKLACKVCENPILTVPFEP